MITWNNPASIALWDCALRHTAQRDSIGTWYVCLQSRRRKYTGRWNRHSVRYVYSDRYHQLHDGYQDRADPVTPGHSGDHVDNPASILMGRHSLHTAQCDCLGTWLVRLYACCGNVPAVHRHTFGYLYPDRYHDYTTATKTVQIDVTQATPVITWINPARSLMERHFRLPS